MLNFVCFFFFSFFAGRIIEGLELPINFSFFFKKIEVRSESPKCFRRIQEENWLSKQILLIMMPFCLYVVA